MCVCVCLFCSVLFHSVVRSGPRLFFLLLLSFSCGQIAHKSTERNQFFFFYFSRLPFYCYHSSYSREKLELAGCNDTQDTASPLFSVIYLARKLNSFSPSSQALPASTLYFVCFSLYKVEASAIVIKQVLLE